MDYSDHATPTRHVIYENNVANDQARVHYGDIHGDVNHGDVYRGDKSFEGMDGHYGRPLEAFSGTYEWILHGETDKHVCDACSELTEHQLDVKAKRRDDDDHHQYAGCKSARLRDTHRNHLRTWLQERASNDTIWVYGKPGSGKSTLMRYTFDELRRLNNEVLAEEWRQMVVGHFFWAAGGPLQKSLVGLLQNLLHQILKDARQLIPQVFSSYQASQHSLQAKTWTFCELSNALKMALRAGPITTQYVLLIDGLDEADGDTQDLCGLLIQLASWDSIKLIVASRPYNVFQNVFGGPRCHSICLQDVNDADIDVYIRSKLDSAGDLVWLSTARLDIAALSELLRDRAEGVFLWVKLAIYDVRQGLGEGDNMTDLMKRVKRMPPELDAFINGIFNSIDEIYHTCNARLILCCLEESPWPDIPSIPLSWARFLAEEVEDPDFALHAPIQQMTSTESGEMEREARASVTKWTRGLMTTEVDFNSCENSTCDKCALDPFRTTIQFVHRSVYDYMLQSKTNGLLAARAGREYSSSLSACRIWSRICAYSGRIVTHSTDVCTFHHAVHMFGINAARLEETDLPLQLLQDLFAMIDRIGKTLCPARHWVFRCGNIQSLPATTRLPALFCVFQHYTNAMDPVGNLDFSLMPHNSACGALTFMLAYGCARTFFTMRKLASDHEIQAMINLWLLIATDPQTFGFFIGQIRSIDDTTVLVLKLVEMGADPNAAIPAASGLKYSAWQRKMIALQRDLLSVRNYTRHINDAWADRQLAIVALLISHGADPDAEVLVDQNYAGIIRYCISNEEWDKWPVKGLTSVVALFGPWFQQKLGEWSRLEPEEYRCPLALFCGIHGMLTQASEDRAREEQVTSRGRKLHFS